MSEDGLSEPCDEPSMELFVESLTGTSFEMRVYPTDTVLDIKNKIFRVEGIPVPQQNLLFQMKELNDHNQLSDLGIVNGSTLRLVTAMRGGPISTRRWTSDHMVWKDLKDLIEHTREELGDKVGTKVSVLVFKEGEVIKWLRVIENEDGSYSPYTEQRAVAPPCASSGSGGGGYGVSSGGAGNSVGGRSGNKHYQHHKASATDAATMSSNNIDFQDLMQYKQHAIALSSYYHQQHHHHHHNNSHLHAGISGSGDSSTMASNSVGEQHHHQLQQHLQQQQQQHQRQQVYRRLEDDVRMKGRVNMLKARIQRAKRCKGKAVALLETGDSNGELTAAEEIAIGRRNDNIMLTAVLNDEFIDEDEDGIDEAFKPDLRLEALLRTLQNNESMVDVTGSGTERYTLAQRYHKRTHSRSSNSNMLQLDTSQLPDDDMMLFKPIPTGHENSKHGTGSSGAYFVGTSTNVSTSTIGKNPSTTGVTSTNSGLNLLLMDCTSAENVAALATNNTSTNSSSCSGGSVNDLEVALKEKHRSSRLRVHATATSAVVRNEACGSSSEDLDTVGKCIKNAVIGRRLSNSLEPTSSSNPINFTTTTTTLAAAATTRSSLISLQESVPTVNNNNCYVCTNLHVFEPQSDVIAPGFRCDISPKRRNSKAGTGTGVVSNSRGMTSGSSDCTKDRISLPETKRRAKIGRLLNTTTTAGSGEASDSDDGLWSWHTTANAANRLRHYRTTTKRIVLPDTALADKGKCEMNGDPTSTMISMEEYTQQHVVLPDIWEHKSSVVSPPSPTNSIITNGGGAGGLLCARATSNVSPSTTLDTLVASTIADGADVVDDNNGVAAAAAACIRDYMDLDSEFDKMFNDLRNAVPVPSIPSAIPPQYAPKDCQLYLGSPVVPRPGAAPSRTGAAESSTAVCSNKSAATAHHRLSPMTTLPYHVQGLCTSPPVGASTRRSPLYHRRTTTAGTGAQSFAAGAGTITSDNDRSAIAAATRNMLGKVQRTATSEISNVTGTVGDKTRQRRRRCSTEDCEFTLERVQNDYIPDGFNYSNFDSCTTDVDDLIGRYGQDAIANARWMEAAAAAAAAATAAAALSATCNGISPQQQLQPTIHQHRSSVRLRTVTAATAATAGYHRDSPMDLHSHLCLTEQIQRLGLNTDATHTGLCNVTTSVTSTIGTRMDANNRTTNNNNNTISTGELAHSNLTSTGLLTSSSNNSTNVIANNSHTKLPTLIEHCKVHQEQEATSVALIPDPRTVAVPLSRTTVPRMRCAHCNRKLNITNIYNCRCGRIFCAQHRYSEVHDCAHDYKTEGRRLLAQQNPLVTAPKLAKF